MTDKKINNLEIASLNYFLTRTFMIGFTFNILIQSLKQDAWIIPILSIIMAIPLIYIISYIINYEPNLNICEKIMKLFNKKIGFLILLLLGILMLFVTVLNYLNLNNFVQSQFLNRTPFLVISIMFMIITYYIISKGINTITRTSNIMFYIGIILLVLSIIGLIPSLNIDNLKPILTSNSTTYLNCLNMFYSYNILPMFLLTIIPKTTLYKPKLKKTLIISYLISAISMFFVVFETLATFGYELSLTYEYAQFFVLKHVALVKISSRVESILAIQLLLDLLIFNIAYIHFISINLKTMFNLKNKFIIYLTPCILVIIATMFIYKYNLYLDNLIYSLFPIIVSIVLTFIIFMITIKIKISKK